MVFSQERPLLGTVPSGVSLVSMSASSGAGVGIQEYVDGDFVRRFHACAAASDAIWYQGWLACRTDGDVVRGSSTMRTTWRAGWIPEPFGVDPDVSLPQLVHCYRSEPLCHVPRQQARTGGHRAWKRAGSSSR